MSLQSIGIVGGGMFGVTAAIALRERGHAVELFDPGPLPHPDAASTDISKVVRIEYGADETYTELGEQAQAGWRRWNAEGGEPLYHETGILALSRKPFAPGGYEHDSFRMLLKRGHRPERLGPEQVAARFPAWRTADYADGFYHARGGYAESGRVVARLVARARRLGVEIVAGRRFARLLERGSKVTGIITDDGQAWLARQVIIAAGAWTGSLLPHLAEILRPSGHPVFHLRPTDPTPYRAGRFSVWCADVANTGWYGFPANRDGIVKVANHGVGKIQHPDLPRQITPGYEERLREFLRASLPGLADAPIVSTRLCFYCDTFDEHFWIARDPDRDGLIVAAGDSGHGFKFAPVIGDIIADIAEGQPHPLAHRFRWRPEVHPAAGEEASRHHGAE
jgi:glycine/D-amino acid oxidase-like deaminating enzyme